MKSPRIWIAILGIISAIFGYLAVNEAKNPGNIKSAPLLPASVGTPATAVFGLTLADLNGRAQALEQWRGKVLVVNYWATWCSPCREEMPGFARLQAKYAAKGVQFVGISIDTAVKVAEFQKETPVNYPLLIGDAGAIDSSVALGNSRQALPFTVVIDRQGRVSAVRLGRFTEADLEPALIELVSRSPQTTPSPDRAPGT